MSANSDARKLIDLAVERGLTVSKTKHGGYAISRDDVVIARVQFGAQRPHSIKNARRAILRSAT